RACQPALSSTPYRAMSRPTHFLRHSLNAQCALLMPPSSRSGAIRTTADKAPVEPLDMPQTDDDSIETGEEKLRSGIQSIEVGFRLLDVLTREPRAMMLRDLAQRAGMSPAKAHRYLVSFLRLGVVA